LKEGGNIMALDMQYVSDKAKEQEDARGEHVKKLLGELIGQLCDDFHSKDRDGVIDIIERFVTKRRTWL